MDQITCIKFCVKNEIKCADEFRMLTLTYSEATLDRSTFIGGIKCSEGKKLADEERAARALQQMKTQKRMNIANKLLGFVRNDSNLYQRDITGDGSWVYVSNVKV